MNPHRATEASRLMAVAATALVLGGCGGSPAPVTSATPATGAPPAATAEPQQTGDLIQRTTFAPSLGVHLDSMSRHPSGLYVQDLVRGKGQLALTGTTLIVRYAGWLPSGKLFDTGEITVKLGSNSTIRGWEEGLLGMRAGGRRRLVVPPNMGYGERGEGEIPGNAVLVFEMELESVL